jgi:hypothetical protein
MERRYKNADRSEKPIHMLHGIKRKVRQPFPIVEEEGDHLRIDGIPLGSDSAEGNGFREPS